MRLELTPRPHVSAVARALAPVAAFLVAFILAGFVVWLLGRSPIAAFRLYVAEPLFDLWSIEKMILRATPLALIAIGLAYCFRANLWNIGAEGQLVMGAIFGGWVALKAHGTDAGFLVLPAMLAAGALGGALYGLIPAFLKVRFNVNEILTSLMLVYIAELTLDYLVRGPWRDPKGFNFPQSVVFDPAATLSPVMFGAFSLATGAIFAVIATVVTAIVLGRTLFGYRLRLTGEAPRAARFAGFSLRGTTLAVFAISGALAGLAGIVEVSGQIGQLVPDISPGYGFTAITIAFLGRLNPVGILIAALVLALLVIGGENAQIMLKLPLDLTTAFQGILLLCVLSADALVSYRVRLVSRGSAVVTIYEAILLTIITASTPLLIAALGELVAERSGVLNLGVEGMMAVGAACSFAAAVSFNSTILGVIFGALAGMSLAALFALVVLGFAANQVGSGLALTILGLGLSGLIGAPFVGSRRDPIGHLGIPGLSDLPVVGSILFSQDAFVYGSLALTIAVGIYLVRSRSGLTLRSVGENHASAHALGLPVLRTRILAILFGGACAGLAGAYLALVYTRFWSPGMTAGRGWIALALVVFAAWRPGWVLIGAYIFGAATVLQLHAQAAQWGLPSQALSAVPYVATILALLLLSIRHGRAIGAPGSLGMPFVPDR